MVNKTALSRAFPIVAQHYGDMLQVRVTVGAAQAATNGSDIYLPAIPEDSRLIASIWGYLIHEAAHCRHTDFRVWRGVDPSNLIRRSLLNVFEDIRIEGLIMADYPGVAHELRRTVEALVESGGFAPVDPSDHPGAVLQAKILYWCRAYVLGQPTHDLERGAETSMQEVFPEGVNLRLQVLLQKSKSLRSTADALSLADAVLTMLQEEAEKERQRREQQKSQESQQCEDGASEPDDRDDGDQGQPGDSSNQSSSQQDKDGDGDASGDQTPEKSSDQPDPSGEQAGDDQGDQSGGRDQNQGQTQAQDQPGGDASSQQDGDSQSEPAGHDDSSPGGAGPGDLEKIIEALAKAGADDLLEDVFEALRAELDKEALPRVPQVTFPPVWDVNAASPETTTDLLRRVEGNSGVLRAQLSGLVQANTRAALSTERSGRRLQGNRLTRIVSGDTRIFRKSHDTTKPNAAVHLLLDTSGSMDKTIGVAQEAALSIAMALESIRGVSVGVSLFGGNIRRAIKHGESPRQMAGKFASHAFGGTPMAPAIWHAAMELSKRREDRKILIVVTDGAPDCSASTAYALDTMVRHGVEPIGIGIKTDAVRGLFPDFIVINSAKELQTTLFGLVRNRLGLRVV